MNRGRIYLAEARDAEAGSHFAAACKLDPSLRPELEDYARKSRAARKRSHK